MRSRFDVLAIPSQLVLLGVLAAGAAGIPCDAAAQSPKAKEAPSGAAAPRDPATPAEPATAQAPATPSPGLPDSAWNALVDSNVELERAGGANTIGVLVAVDETTVSVMQEDGTIAALPRAEITTVRSLAKPTSAPLAAPASETDPVQAEPVGTGWAVAGTATGLSMVSVGALLGIGSEITVEEQIPALPLGGVATMMFAAGIPIIAASGSSERRAAGVRGSPGARITGWVGYGLAMTNALVLIGLGSAEVEVQHGQVASVVILAVTSGALMAADAMKSRRQATAKQRESSNVAIRRLSLAPLPLRSRGATHGGVLSLSGRF